MQTINRAKFLELIDQSKGLLGDLQEHEEMKESRTANFYKPGADGTDAIEVINFDGHPEQLNAVQEEENEGEVVVAGKQGSAL